MSKLFPRRVPAMLLALTALTALTATAQTPQRKKYQRDFTTEIAPCGMSGESIPLEGRMNVIAQVVSDNNGGYHYTAHVNYNGTGTSKAGQHYSFSQADARTQYLAPDAKEGDGTFTLTESTVIRVHAAGSGGDYYMRVTNKITINANGEVTVHDYLNFEKVCQ